MVDLIAEEIREIARQSRDRPTQLADCVSRDVSAFCSDELIGFRIDKIASNIKY